MQGSELFRSREQEFYEEMLIFIPLFLHCRYRKKKEKKQALIYMGADYAQINCVFVFRCFVLIRRT